MVQEPLSPQKKQKCPKGAFFISGGELRLLA